MNNTDTTLTVTDDGNIGILWSGNQDQLDNPPVDGTPIIVPDAVIVLD